MSINNVASRQALQSAIEETRRAIEGLEAALTALEETLKGEEPISLQKGSGIDLLSILEIGQELGMSKSWVYQRVRSGEIPSVKLGHNVKVRRQALEQYLERQQYRHSDEKKLEGED